MSSDGKHLSIIVQFEGDPPSSERAVLEFLDPDDTARFLRVGQRLGIMEGPKRVADAEIVRVPESIK